MTDEAPASPEKPDLDRASELLDRTRRFLEQCAESPDAAFEAEDPETLRADLEDLAPRPQRVDADEDPPVEHRRSA